MNHEEIKKNTTSRREPPGAMRQPPDDSDPGQPKPSSNPGNPETHTQPHSPAGSAEYSTPQPPAPNEKPSDEAAEIAALFEQLRREYMANFYRYIDRLDKLINIYDTPRIAALGHMLKGNGASYGFDEITLIGAEIETLAKADNLAAVLPLIRRLRQIQAEFEKNTNQHSEQQT